VAVAQLVFVRPMRTLFATMCLLLVAAAPTPVAVSVQLLVGEWRSDGGTTYHFYSTGAFSSHIADEGYGGRWKLRHGDQIELTFDDARDKPGQPKRRETIRINRVMHETLYTSIGGTKEIWLKQPGA
jgi:hypothetical protein